MTLETMTGFAIVSAAILLALIALALRMRRRARETPAPPAYPSPEAAAADSAPDAVSPVEIILPPVMENAPPQAAAETAPAAGAPPKAETPRAAPKAPGSVPEPPAGEPVEVMRVLRDARQGSLIVEMDGRRFLRVDDIKDQRQGMSLVDAVIDLQQFVGLDVIVPLAAEQVLERPAPESAAPLQRPSLNPIKQMFILKDRELRKAREKDAVPQPGSIVEEIEAILVRRLIGSPFAGRSIHMRPGLHGGAHIDVDGRGYDSIEAVADSDVKEFLKAVIAEWERQ